MSPSRGARRRRLLSIGGKALVGYATPPAVVAVGIWSVVTLSGMQRPQLRGLFAHLTGASVPVTLAPTSLASEQTLDRAWFAETTTSLEALGFRVDGERVVRRAAYRGWLRLFLHDEVTLAAFARQTTYPGAPAPNVAYVSACSPSGDLLWVETSDESAPAGDTGYPPFLRVVLAPELELPALLARHRDVVAEQCGDAELEAISTASLTSMIQADRQWWFDWCATSLVGMAADCKGEDEQPR